MPADRQFLVDLIDPEAIVEEARIAKEAGAEFVVVSLHWGAEYRHEPIQSQIDWLDAILPTDEVDLVIGHHAHVVQPVDKVGDEWVVFGIGNFLSNQSANCCVAASQDGMIATIELLENDAGEIEAIGVHYIPTWVDRADGYVIRISEPGRTDVPEATATTLETSYNRTLEVVSSRLGAADGLTIGFGLEPGASSVLPAAAE
jgi:poly-gamma-glutamate synthesis protein (capsule biosynthesis protein)